MHRLSEDAKAANTTMVSQAQPSRYWTMVSTYT
jgi:hypothetical protein